MAAELLIQYLDTEFFIKSSTNATRLIAKLKLAVQKKEFYEAHQIIRTIYFRFINQKEKIRALEHLLYLASTYLFQYKENISGQDLAFLHLESVSKCLNYHHEDVGEEAKLYLAEPSMTVHKQKGTLDLELSQKVAKIAVLLPDSHIGRNKFIAEALRILNTKTLNTDLLQNSLAIELYMNNDFQNSKYLYLHCASKENTNQVADLLVSYHRQCNVSVEVDLFVTQFILQFLCLQNPIDTPNPYNSRKKQTTNSSSVIPKTRSDIKCIADRILRLYAQRHPLLVEISWPYKSYPLLNFTHFIITLIDSNEAPTFKLLREIYQVAWLRDTEFPKYLDRIAMIYFGVVDESKQRHGGGFFNNVILSLLDATDDDDCEDEFDKQDTKQDASISSSDELD